MRKQIGKNDPNKLKNELVGGKKELLSESTIDSTYWKKKIMSRSPEESLEAIRKAGNEKAVEAIPALLDLLRHSRRIDPLIVEPCYIIGEACDALFAMGRKDDSFIDELISIAKLSDNDLDFGTVVDIECLLGKLGNKRAVPFLLGNAVRFNENPPYYCTAVQVLGQLGEHSFIPALKSLAQEYVNGQNYTTYRHSEIEELLIKAFFDLGVSEEEVDFIFDPDPKNKQKH